MRAEPCPDHDAVGIDGLAVFAVAIASADGTEKSVFGEFPHDLLLQVRLAFRSLAHAVKRDDNLDRCNLLANEFKITWDRFRQAACFTAAKGLDALEAEFKQLRDRMEEMKRMSVAIPEWAYKQARSNVNSKDYEFNIDLAALEANENKMS